VDALFARVAREWGTVDILSNNAGIGELSPPLRAQTEQAFQAIMGGARRSLGVTSRMDDAEWRRMLDVHLFGTFACTRAALRIMEERGRGAIVNMPRGGARRHSGLGALRRRQGRDHRLHQVGGAGGGRRQHPRERDRARPDRHADDRRHPAAASPDGAPAHAPRPDRRAEDIAAVALFLVSDEASFVTGQVVSPNGGFYT